MTGSSATGQDTTDRTSFEAANSGLTFSNITFAGLDNTYSTSAGLQVLVNSYGVQFVGTSNPSNAYDLQVVNPFNAAAGGASWGGADVLQVGNNTAGQITITIPSGLNVLAIAFDLLQNQNNFGLPFDVTVNNGTSTTYQSAGGTTLPGSVFVGISSATDITSITISNEYATPIIALDNLDLGTGGGSGPSDAPEGATLLLIGGGLMMMRFFKKRDQKRQSQAPRIDPKLPTISPLSATEPQGC